MGEKRGTKALEVWCKRVTEGYPGVKVENMTTSWRDGLAFCALIHHFRPDLIDFESLDKRDVYRNNELAFRIAERHLGIPALLDAEDMVEYEVPDRLSMLTYLSQFYQTFVSQQGHSPNSRTPIKRSSVSPSLSSSPDMSPSMSPTSSSPPSKVLARGVSGGQSSRSVHDVCTHCGLPVYLAERLLVGSKRTLYHRTCFRCARCSAQLTLANCYETENGKFCCETCPDEELDKSDTSSLGTDRVDSKRESICSVEAACKSVNDKYSSNENEKISVFHVEGNSRDNSDEYSAIFESTVEKFPARNTPFYANAGTAPLATTQETSTDLFSKSDDSSQKDLRLIVNNESDEDLSAKLTLSNDSEPVDQCEELSLCQSTKEGTKPLKIALAEIEVMASGFAQKNSESGYPMPFQDVKFDVYGLGNSSSYSSKVSPDNVSVVPDKEINCTKDSKISSADSSVSSIVKMRRMMFEGENNNISVENFTPRKLGVATRRVDFGDLNPLEKKESGRPKKSETSESERKKQSVKDALLSKETSGAEDFVKTEEGNSQNIAFNKIESSELLNNLAEDGSPNLGERYSEQFCSEEVQETFDSNNSKEKVNRDVTQKERLESESAHGEVCLEPQLGPRKVFLALDPILLESDVKEVCDYPPELNPFEDDDEEKINPDLVLSSTQTEKQNTNPFGSSDEDEHVTLRSKPSAEKPSRLLPLMASCEDGVDVEGMSAASGARSATVNVMSMSPLPVQRSVIPVAPNVNPFWSDGEEPEEEDCSAPVPLPRTIRVTPEPSPRPRTTLGTPSKMTSSSGKFGSSSSLSSMVSHTGTNRRSKKPAPAPPSSLEGQNVSSPPSPNPCLRSPHKRKSRPAPPPPTSLLHSMASGENILKRTSLDGRKLRKDEANRCKQAVSKEEPTVLRDKSTFGQWKRKKGPAPPRPLPQRRQVCAMPLKELKRELDDIEVKQQELERQGVKLEQTIRQKFDNTPQLNESSMTPDVEDLVIQLFELVNEKNELFRKQAELMYLRRQQRLEEEHAEIEYQIRCLMEQPECNKTDMMKAREEELIQRLVEIVERRNEIIECLEMDRIREAEEDQSIHMRLGLFAAKYSKEDKEPSPSKTKKDKKKKKKEKDIKKKRDSRVDADKDIDEVEAAAVAAAKEKKSKKKWF